MFYKYQDAPSLPDNLALCTWYFQARFRAVFAAAPSVMQTSVQE